MSEPKHDSTCIRWLQVRIIYVFTILHLVFFKGFLALLVTAGITCASLIVDPSELLIGDNKPHHVIFSCHELIEGKLHRVEENVSYYLILCLFTHECYCSFFCGPQGHFYVVSLPPSLKIDQGV